MEKKHVPPFARRINAAAAAGETSIVESLLAYISAHKGPAETDAAAQRAIMVAARARRWATVSYLADFLSDTERVPPMEGADAANERLALEGKEPPFAGPPFDITSAVISKS